MKRRKKRERMGKKRKNRTMEPAMSLPAEETIASLGNGNQPLANSGLICLSNLNSAEMVLFEQAWVALGVGRRRQIMQRLVEMAEDSFELDFDGIFKYCLKDEDAEVRSLAVEGLWESEEASLISPLINLLEQDSSEKVQAAAATALGKFALLAELEKLRSCHASRVCNALLAAAGDESKPLDVRRRALEAVAPSSLPEVTTAIMAAYQSPSSRLKASAIYAMGKNCGRYWLPVLLNELVSAEDEIRYEAAGACGELGDAEAVPQLIRLASDPDADVQLAAIQALGKIGGKDAKEYLKQCLTHPRQAMREAAEQALDELAAEEAPLFFWGMV
jgi:HEAT repeat protein